MSDFDIDVELEDEDILCAFIITCPSSITPEERESIEQQWTEWVRPTAVDSMARFIHNMEVNRDGGRVGG